MIWLGNPPAPRQSAAPKTGALSRPSMPKTAVVRFTTKRRRNGSAGGSGKSENDGIRGHTRHSASASASSEGRGDDSSGPRNEHNQPTLTDGDDHATTSKECGTKLDPGCLTIHRRAAPSAKSVADQAVRTGGEIRIQAYRPRGGQKIVRKDLKDLRLRIRRAAKGTLRRSNG